MADAWDTLSKLPFPMWTGGVARMPHVLRLQQDPIALALMPASMQAPGAVASPSRTEGFVRHWGVQPVEVSGVVAPTDVEDDVSVQNDPQRVRWCEDCNCIRDLAINTTPLVWELARCEVPDYAVGRLERIATFLSALPVRPDGQAQGPPFVTGMDTPLCTPVDHPDPAAAPLEVRWSLRAEGGDPVPPLVAAPRAFIPITAPIDGLPLDWTDFRYTWHGLYTVDQGAVLRAPHTRLFVTLASASPDRWRVTAGGLLTIWWQTVNAFNPAAARVSVRSRYP